MIKEAIQFITDLATGEVLTANGKSYSRFELTELPGPRPLGKPIGVHSLGGLVEYIKKAKEEYEATQPRLHIVHVVDHKTVSFMSSMVGDWKQRDVFIQAEPFTGQEFRMGQYVDVETFVVGLQTSFVQDENTAAILRMVGNIQASAVHTVTDDGVSQEVTVRRGVTKVGNEIVVSPVDLRPFRTFQEIEQPASKFVLRLRREDDNGMPEIALFEVDSKVWKLMAVNSIKEYLEKNAKGTIVLA